MPIKDAPWVGLHGEDWDDLLRRVSGYGYEDEEEDDESVWADE